MEDNKKNYFIITETIVFLVIMLLLLRMYLEEKTLRKYKKKLGNSSYFRYIWIYSKWRLWRKWLFYNQRQKFLL